MQYYELSSEFEGDKISDVAIGLWHTLVVLK